jgi:hypothetical protein
MSTADSTPAPAPWYAAYPAPKSEVVTISREEVLEMLKSTPVEKRDFVLVDLRRNDFEVSYGHQNNRVVWIPPHFSQNSGNKQQLEPF